MVDGWLEVEVRSMASTPSLELVDVEVVDFPPATYFKIAVFSDEGVHHVTRRYADLQLLNEAIVRELGLAKAETQLPHVRSEAELAEPQHRLKVAAFFDMRPTRSGTFFRHLTIVGRSANPSYQLQMRAWRCSAQELL